MHVSSFHLANSESLSWVESPFAGVSHKMLKVGHHGFGVVDLTRIDEGAGLPPHRHAVAQRSFFLRGIAEALDGTTIMPGSYAEVPPGARHGTKSVEGELVILNFFDGIATWFLDDGDIFAVRANGEFTRLGKLESLGHESLL
jgi:quercetin dioxygenase-like cupin family protein